MEKKTIYLKEYPEHIAKTDSKLRATVKTILEKDLQNIKN